MIQHKEFPGPNGRIKDADRELLLKVLASMTIDLPPKTKMPAEALDKRLSKALNSAQRFTKNLISRDAPLSPRIQHGKPETRSKRDMLDAGQNGACTLSTIPQPSR